MCLTEGIYKKSEAGNSKGLGKVYCKCFIQISGPGPGGPEEMEVFLPAPVESVSKTGRIKDIRATKPDTEMIDFCLPSSLSTRIS